MKLMKGFLANIIIFNIVMGTIYNFDITAYSYSGEELILNGGFETFDSTLEQMVAGSSAYTNKAVNSGRKSYRLCGSASYEQYLSFKNITLQEEKIYKLSCYIKCDNVSNPDGSVSLNGVSVNVLGIDSAKQRTDWLYNSETGDKKILSTGGTHDFIRLEYEFSVVDFPVNADKCHVYIRMDSNIGGTAYVDDVSLQIAEHGARIKRIAPRNVFILNNEVRFTVELFNESSALGLFKISYNVYNDLNEHICSSASVQQVEAGTKILYGIYIPQMKCGVYYININVVYPNGVKKVFMDSFSVILKDNTANKNTFMGTTTHAGVGKNDIDSIDFAAIAGNGWIRSEIPWAIIETERGKYDIEGSKPAEVLKYIYNSGQNPLVLLGYGNKLYLPGTNYLPETEEQLSAFASYCNAVASWIKDQGFDASRVAFQVSNEIGSPLVNSGSMPRTQFYKVMKAAYESVKTVLPNSCVLSEGMEHPTEEKLLDYVQSGLPQYCDYIAIHPYSRPDMPDATLPDLLNKFRSILNQYNFGDKGIWITEIGWNTGNSRFGETSERLSAIGLVRTAAIINSFNTGSSKESRFTWYKLEDGTYENEKEQYGLFKLDFHKVGPRTAKANYPSFVICAELMRDLKFVDGETTDDNIRIYNFERKTDGKNVAVLWTLEHDEAVSVQLDDRSCTVYDIFGNKTERNVPGNSITLGLTSEPIFLEGDIGKFNYQSGSTYIDFYTKEAILGQTVHAYIKTDASLSQEDVSVFLPQGFELVGTYPESGFDRNGVKRFDIRVPNVCSRSRNRISFRNEGVELYYYLNVQISAPNTVNILADGSFEQGDWEKAAGESGISYINSDICHEATALSMGGIQPGTATIINNSFIKYPKNKSLEISVWAKKTEGEEGRISVYTEEYMENLENSIEKTVFHMSFIPTDEWREYKVLYPYHKFAENSKYIRLKIQMESQAQFRVLLDNAQMVSVEQVKGNNELLSEAGFEINEFNGRSWYKGNTHSFDAVIDSSEKHSGNSSLRISYTNPNNVQYYYPRVMNSGTEHESVDKTADYGWIPVDTTKTYEISFWMKAERPSDERNINVLLGCYWGESSSTMIAENELMINPPTTEWKKYTYILTPEQIPTKTVSGEIKYTKNFRFIIQAKSGLEGFVWVDDCSIKESTEYMGNTMKYGNMENNGWIKMNGTFSFDCENVHTGNKSIKLLSSGTGQIQVATNSYIKASTSGKYQISLWAKADKDDVGNLELVLHSGNLDTNNTAVYNGWTPKFTLSPDSEWRRYTYILDLADPATGINKEGVVFRVNLYSRTEEEGGIKKNACVWVDDFVIQNLDREYSYIKDVYAHDGGYYVTGNIMGKDVSEVNIITCCVYKNDGTLKGTVLLYEPLTSIGDNTFEFDIECEKDEGDYVKLFVWKENSLMPKTFNSKMKT